MKHIGLEFSPLSMVLTGVLPAATWAPVRRASKMDPMAPSERNSGY